MARQTINRLLVSATLLGMMMLAGNLVAQPAAGTSGNGTGQQAENPRSAQRRATAENNPGCQRILSECKNLGFVDGQWKKDNGLWRDCFDPVLRGRTPTRDGKPINVPVSASAIGACRSAMRYR